VKKTDWWWLLGFPVYLILGTARHEGAHALAAWLQGADIVEFVVIPGVRDGGLYFGYVQWSGGNPNWLTTAAPYFLDLLTFGIFFAVCYFGAFRRRWLWLNLVIIGMISPLVNSGYQYLKPGLQMGGDIGWLLLRLPPVWMHTYLIVTLVLYLVGLGLVFRQARFIRTITSGRDD
jgi:hypothetical protein